MLSFPDPLTLALAALLGWGLIGLLGLLRPASLVYVGRVLFPLGALCALLLALAALAALPAEPRHMILPLGLPGLPFSLRLDPLSAFFLFLLGGTAAGVSGRVSAGCYPSGKTGQRF